MPTLRRLSWAILGLLLVLLLCHQWFGPDIWYHLYLGGRVAETGQPQPSDRLLLHQAEYVNFYWLFQLVVRGAWAVGGLHGVSFLFILVWGGALAAWATAAGLPRSGAWGPAAALFALIVCQTRFEQRPEIFSYLFAALEILWLMRWRFDAAPSRGECARLLLMQAVWCNVHGYFVFGPFLAAVRLIGGVPGCRSDGRFRPGWLALAALTPALALAGAASPFGWRTWEEVALLGNFLDRMHLQIQEFLPPTGGPPLRLWTVKLFWGWWGCVLLAGVAVAARRARGELFALILAAAGLWLSMGAFRNIPLAVFFSAPLLAAALPRLARRAPLPAAAWGAVPLLGAGLCAWVLQGGFHRSTDSPSGFGIRESEYAYPVHFADYLRRTGFRGKLFNQSSDGGYLEFHFPDLPLYADSRFVDTRLVRGYFAAIQDPRGFEVVQRRFGFDGALLPVLTSREVVAALLRDPDWRLAYADLHRAFFASNRSPAGAAAPAEEPRFYRGEDLTRPEFGIPAARWAGLLAEADDRERLLLALRQLSAAPAVPAAVADIAEDYARREGDGEVADAARALRARATAR